MLNPVKLMNLKSLKNQFAKNHPKFTKFLYAVWETALVEGTVIQIQVKTPDNRTLSSNLKRKKEDLELLDKFK